MIRSVALALITAVSAGPAPAGARAGSLVALVAAGGRSWTTPPGPRAPGPGVGRRVSEGGLRPLADGVARGERLYASRCRSCHDLGDVPPAALRFPRAVNGQVESLERFLGGHPPGLSPLGWDGQPTADLIAFLISSVGGRPASGSP